MTPFERASTAVMEAMGDGPGSRDYMRANAIVRAVLNAIRDPSDAMKSAGMDACGGDGSVLDGYEAMIDAMLEEG